MTKQFAPASAGNLAIVSSAKIGKAVVLGYAFSQQLADRLTGKRTERGMMSNGQSVWVVQ